MGGGRSDWRKELGRFLEPFLDRLGHKARRQMCPAYVAGLIGSGDRKSIQPMAARDGQVGYDQLIPLRCPDARPYARTQGLHRLDRLTFK